ncbi:hypothetical protein BH11ACT8_BH11ACT8_23950 [soil metagenome]
MLFLAGVARSGTTALHAVLGAHPNIAVGMERFKRLWGDRIAEITPERFERDRFFDFSDGCTNITPEVEWAQERLADLDAKWDTARYHGDKMTVIRAQRLWQTFPEARFVFIVRDVSLVASSWERRAADPSDVTWRRDADAATAVAAWNTALQRVHRAVTQRPERAVVVDYTRFFGDPEGTAFRGVLDFLALDPAPILERWHDSHRTYVDRVAGRDRTLPPETATFIEEHSDRATWEQVAALSL